MTIELPSAAELMREAIVIARGHTSGPHDLARAELLLKLARELRVGTPKVPAGTGHVAPPADRNLWVIPTDETKLVRLTDLPPAEDAPPAEAPISAPLWNRTTETHPLDAAGVAADEASEPERKTERFAKLPPFPMPFSATERLQMVGRALRLGRPDPADETYAGEPAAQRVERLIANSELAASEERARQAWAVPESWRTQLHADAATVAFPEGLTEVARQLQIGPEDGPTETLKTFAKQQADVGTCKHCGQRIRYARMSPDHEVPQWYHDLSVQRVCSMRYDVDVEPIGPRHTYAEPIA